MYSEPIYIPGDMPTQPFSLTKIRGPSFSPKTCSNIQQPDAYTFGYLAIWVNPALIGGILHECEMNEKVGEIKEANQQRHSCCRVLSTTNLGDGYPNMIMQVFHVWFTSQIIGASAIPTQ